MNCLFYYAFVFGLLPFVVKAQTSKIFFWKFDTFSQQLPTCQQLKIVVQTTGVNGTSTGTPPYYMNAFAPGGAAETQLIGTDPTNLQWTPRFPANTQLMLNVIDSNGSSGGVPTQLFTVATGQNTNCIPATLSNPAKDFAVSANVTDKVETCDAWGIRVTGGVKPYKITLVALNSPVTTNVTMGAVDDAFVFIDRADPNTKLLAAISDFTGRWAFGSPIVSTFGSSDVDCPAKNSVSTSTQVLDQDAANLKKASQKRQTALIAGIVVPIVVLLVGGTIGFIFWWRRRQANGGNGTSRAMFGKQGAPKRLASTDELHNQPSPAYVENGQMQMEARQDGQVLSIASYLDGPPARAHTVTGSMSTHMTMSPTGSHATSPTFSVPGSAYTTRSTSLPSGGGVRPGFNNFPRQSVRNGRGSAKAMEAGYSLDDDESGAGPSLPSAIASSHGYAPSHYRTVESPVGSGRPLPQPNGQQDIVYQHTDSQVTVQELPPPYMPQGGR